MPEKPSSRTIPALIAELAERYPDREALVGQGARYTYRTLATEVERTARGLLAQGIGRGDKVAILAGNLPDWIVADLAIVSIGAIMVSVNTWVTARELEYVLEHSDARMLITQGRFLKYDYLQMLAPMRSRLPLLEHVVQIPGGLAELARAGERVRGPLPDVQPDDLAYLLYTSGSTAAPKGVCLQHAGLIENMWQIGERQHTTDHDRLWLAVSLYWGLGCENALFNLMTHGGCIVLQEHFEPGAALELIEHERCTMIYATPNMVQALAEHPDRARRDLSRLRGGASIGTPEQFQRAVDLGAREVCNIYGLTETYGNSHVTDASDPLELRSRGVGRPLDGVTVKIADPETGAALPAGQVGEVRVKGHVTTGYYKDPVRTAELFDADGWFCTGDLGMEDERGYLFFRGRLKEMIKTGGINVAPVEVEDILMRHPGVQLAFCTGVPDAERDEVVGAVIVPKVGAALDEKALTAYCRESLAAYKVPRLWCFTSESALPLTSTGKLQKNRLAATFFPDGRDRRA